MLVASVHSVSLTQLARDPTLSPLIGVKSAPISDVRMRESRSETKYQEFLEGEPAFKTVVEIHDDGTWRIYDDVRRSVTELLQSPDHADGGREVDPFSQNLE